MMKVKALVAFAIFDEKNGSKAIGEGEEAEIDSAEAKRLADAGIVEILGKGDAPAIENTAMPQDEIENTAVKSSRKKKE